MQLYLYFTRTNIISDIKRKLFFKVIMRNCKLVINVSLFFITESYVPLYYIIYILIHFNYKNDTLEAETNF